jgi:radical SAM protein with 4Fe4S-binding SPASM domain
MENLNLVLKKKRELSRRNPYISWQFLVFRHNEHEIDDVKMIAEEMGVDHIGITKAFIGDKDWVPLNPQYSHYNREKAQEIDKKRTSDFFNEPKEKLCNWPWEVIVINSNGSVSPCCSIEDEKDDFGNIFDSPFKEIWNNGKYLKARRFIKDRIKTEEDNICFNCKHLGLINLDILSCHSLFNHIE